MHYVCMFEKVVSLHGTWGLGWGTAGSEAGVTFGCSAWSQVEPMRSGTRTERGAVDSGARFLLSRFCGSYANSVRSLCFRHMEARILFRDVWEMGEVGIWALCWPLPYPALPVPFSSCRNNGRSAQGEETLIIYLVCAVYWGKTVGMVTHRNQKDFTGLNWWG